MQHFCITRKEAHLGSFVILIATFFPTTVFANGHNFFLNVCWNGIACEGLNAVTVRFNVAFFGAAGVIALAIFLIGAFLLVLGGINETLRQSGTRIMKSSLIGLAIIAGSYGIYRTVVYLLYS